MTMTTNEIAIAEIARDIKYIAKRLDEGSANFTHIEARLSQLEGHINKLYGGLVLSSILIPIILRYMEK